MTKYQTFALALSVCIMSTATLADTTAEQGPAPLAISFMTQFYDVPAEAVTVTITEQSRFAAKVKAEVDGHVCTFDAVKISDNPNAKHGWGAGSMECGA